MIKKLTKPNVFQRLAALEAAVATLTSDLQAILDANKDMQDIDILEDEENDNVE